MPLLGYAVDIHCPTCDAPVGIECMGQTCDSRLRASRALASGHEPVVWADDVSPFTGAEVKVLLDENEDLREALALVAEALNIPGFKPSVEDKDLLLLVPLQTKFVLETLHHLLLLDSKATP